MSYHGLPVNQLPKACKANACYSCDVPCATLKNKAKDCYRQQCYVTSTLLANKLSLSKDQYGVAFQSRLGGAKWIQPYSDQQLLGIYNGGIKRLAVVCPSFVADCLETLEEIQIGLKEQWLAMGGESLVLVPCLNDSPLWVDALSSMVRSHTN